MNAKLVFGVGINDWHSNVYLNRKPIWQYRLWKNVLQRCFVKEIKEKHPTYMDVSCNPNWVYMSNFVDDVESIENHDRFDSDRWEFDKDILVKGNKFYSVETVCFVPKEINNLFTKSNATRGDLPIGVHYNKLQEKYTARVRCGSEGHKALGVHADPLSAFNVYKKAKEEYIKKVAERWKGIVANNVYEALMNYEVSIND